MIYAPVPNGMDSTRRSVPSPRGRPRRGDDVSSSIPSTIFSSARTAASSSPFSHKNRANRSRSARALALISTRAIPHISSALSSLSTTKPPAHRESLPLYSDTPPTLPCPRASDAHTLLPHPSTAQEHEDKAEWEEYLSTGEAIPGERVVSWLKEMIAQRKYVEWRE